MRTGQRLVVALLWAVASSSSASSTTPAASASPAPEEVAAVLQRQAQELVDAITHGKPEVWDRYLHDRAFVTAEDGKVYTKAEMLKDIRPLPAGVSGRIEVTEFQAFVHGPVAVTTHINDERETYHGHELRCRYRTTGTWLQTPEGWRLIGEQILALRTDPPAVELPAAQLDGYVGRYSLAPEITYEIRRKGDGLEGQRSGREPEALKVEAPDVLFVPGQPRYRKIFRRGTDGKVTGYAERREAWDLDWKRMP